MLARCRKPSRAERRAHCEPFGQNPGRLGGDDQPILFVGAAESRWRRTHHVWIGIGDHRRRNGVDEHGAHGRPQGRAEPHVDRFLSRRLSEHRSGRREPRARVRDHARGAGRLRIRKPSAGDRRHRRRPVRRRDRAGHCPAHRWEERQSRAGERSQIRRRRRAPPRYIARSLGAASASVPRPRLRDGG